jgi:sulfur relay (sulfurtransferase) DsrF/TusC family protein
VAIPPKIANLTTKPAVLAGCGVLKCFVITKSIKKQTIKFNKTCILDIKKISNKVLEQLAIPASILE